MECSQNRQLSIAFKDRNDQRKSIIAEEKRRWKIRFYSKNGKPDRQRRPGRPWDPSILEAAKEKITYTGGADIDLTALNEGNFDSSLTGAGGSKETVDKVVKQVALQNYLNEVAKYEQLMIPLQKIMEDTIKRSSHPDSGYGTIGPELHAAAENNMVIPLPTPPRQKRPLTADFKAIIAENTMRGTTYADPDNKMALATLPDNSSVATSRAKACDDNASVSSLGERNPGDGDILNSRTSRFGPSKFVKISSPASNVKSLMSRSATSSQLQPDSLFMNERTSQVEPTPTRQRWNRRNESDDAETNPEILKKSSGFSMVPVKKKRGSSIPWHLLDQLDGEKRKFEAERDYILETKRF